MEEFCLLANLVSIQVDTTVYAAIVFRVALGDDPVLLLSFLRLCLLDRCMNLPDAHASDLDVVLGLNVPFADEAEFSVDGVVDLARELRIFVEVGYIRLGCVHFGCIVYLFFLLMFLFGFLCELSAGYRFINVTLFVFGFF